MQNAKKKRLSKILRPDQFHDMTLFSTTAHLPGSGSLKNVKKTAWLPVNGLSRLQSAPIILAHLFPPVICQAHCGSRSKECRCGSACKPRAGCCSTTCIEVEMRQGKGKLEAGDEAAFATSLWSMWLWSRIRAGKYGDHGDYQENYNWQIAWRMNPPKSVRHSFKLSPPLLVDIYIYIWNILNFSSSNNCYNYEKNRSLFFQFSDFLSLYIVSKPQPTRQSASIWPQNFVEGYTRKFGSITSVSSNPLRLP